MNWKRILKRILLGKVSLGYCSWQKWNTVGFEKYWSNRLFYLNISKLSFHLDCRINWLEDMITGIPR